MDETKQPLNLLTPKSRLELNKVAEIRQAVNNDLNKVIGKFALLHSADIDAFSKIWRDNKMDLLVEGQISHHIARQ
ncbi:MAG: hypothetical protein MHPSP_004406, partial [Paramarteilia canceri]